MQVNTKFDIGDIVKFNKVTTYRNKESERELHAGIITKILISKSEISFLMHSSYQNWVVEDEIISILEKGV